MIDTDLDTSNFHLCSYGWDLYREWCRVEEEKIKDKGKAKYYYIQHRRTCDLCTKWVEKYDRK